MDGSADLRTRLRAVVAHRMETDPAHDLAHLDRVWTNARAIADDQTDMSVLLAASYLHDLVNLPKDDPDRHLASRRSAAESEPILKEIGFEADQVRAIQHAIEAHSFSADIPLKRSRHAFCAMRTALTPRAPSVSPATFPFPEPWGALFIILRTLLPKPGHWMTFISRSTTGR